MNEEDQPIRKVLKWLEAANMPRILDTFIPWPHTMYISFAEGLTLRQIDQIEAMNILVTRTRIERRFMLTFVPSEDGES